MNLKDLFQTLGQKSGFQVVGEPTADENQLRVIGRLPRNKGVQAWLLVVNALLARSEAAPWKIDVSKQYFRRQGHVVYGWRLIVRTESLSADMPDIIRTIATAPRPAQEEVTEMPLIGSSANRNDTTATGKGAGYSGKVAVGQFAAGRLRGGG
jgi:hypothetical protein